MKAVCIAFIVVGVLTILAESQDLRRDDKVSTLLICNYTLN